MASAAQIRSVEQLSDAEVARQLGVRLSYVRRVRSRSAVRGRPAGHGHEVRVRLGRSTMRLLRTYAVANSVSMPDAVAMLLAVALDAS